MTRTKIKYNNEIKDIQIFEKVTEVFRSITEANRKNESKSDLRKKTIKKYRTNQWKIIYEITTW